MDVIWICDKKVVPHLLCEGRLLVELPLRVSFEYALESGAVVDGSLSIKVLYNGRSVGKRFPNIEEAVLNADLEKTANDAICEHLARSGITPSDAADTVVVAAH